MKQLLLALLLLLALRGQAQTILVQESFETDGEGTRYTSTAFDLRAPGNTTQYFTREDNPVQTSWGQQTFGSAQKPTTIGNSGTGTPNGQWFWACEGVRGRGITSERPPGTLTLNPVAVTGYANLSVTVALADAVGPGTDIYVVNRSSTAEPTDHVRIQYSYDGVTYTTVGDFSGTKPGDLSNWRVVGGTTELTGTLQDFTFPIGTPAGPTLYVRVEADYPGASKEIAFDNIRLTGTLTSNPLTLTGIETTPAVYAEGGPDVLVTRTIVPGNPTGTTLTGALVQIQSGLVDNQDLLTVVPANDIFASYNTRTGLLSLWGTASVAAYEATLRSVAYRNRNTTNATAGPRTISFTVSDGPRTSPVQTRIVEVTTALNGPTPLNYTENFETDGEGTRYGSNNFSRNQQAFNRATQNPLPGIGGTTYANIEQSGYWYAEGTKDNASGQVGILQLAPVNATGFRDLRFALRLGRASNWGIGDYVRLSYNRNNGTGWQVFGAFYGILSTGELRQDADLDGVADATGLLLNSTLQDIDFALPTALDGAASLSFRVEVANNGGEELALDLIRITGAANRPPTLAPQGFSLPENAATNTLVGTVAATDPDPGQTLSYALTGGNPGGAFALDGSTGQLWVAAPAALNFETTPTFLLTVQVTDNGTPALSASNVVTVNLTNVNEAPGPVADANPAANAVAEGAAAGTPVGLTATATDPDAGTTLTYSLTDDAGGRFAINSSTGVVTVANGLLLDYETAPTHPVTVRASDGANGSSTTFTVQVTDVPSAAYVSSTAEQITRPVVVGAFSQAILRIPVVLTADADDPLTATAFTFSTAGTTTPADVAAARLYYTGPSSTFATGTLFGSTGAAPGPGPVTIGGSQVLQPGTNYFWLAYDVAPAAVGNWLDGTLTSLVLAGTPRTPTVAAPAGGRVLTAFSREAGTALRLSGTARGYVDLGPDLVLGPQYTQEIWVKPNGSSGSGFGGVLGYDPGAAGQRSPFIAISGDNRVRIGFGTGLDLITTTTAASVLTPGQWNQVVTTYTGTTLTLYVNGEVIASLVSGRTPLPTPVRYVGTLSSTATSFFAGQLDEVVLWNRALSLDEVRQRRHLVLRSAEAGLVAYLQFNESSGSITDLLSGASGVLTGAGVSREPSTAPVGRGVSSVQAVAGNGSVSFDGTSVGIDFAGVTGPLSVSVARVEAPPQGLPPAGVVQTYTPAYWIINRYGAGSFTNAATTYTLGTGAISPTDASNPTQTLQLLKRSSNSDGAWEPALAATAANAAAGTVQFNLSSFSQTVVGTTGTSPLPVELTDFAATYAGGAVALKWHTATEQHSRHFEVERSLDGRTFAAIGTVAAAGTSTSSRAYALTDRALPPGAALLYYRLRQVDLDGTAAYSPVRAVRLDAGPEPVRLRAYPNPAHQALRVSLTGPAPAAALVLLNTVGQVVARLPFAAPGPEQQVLLPPLPAGLYVLRYGALTQRLTLE